MDNGVKRPWLSKTIWLNFAFGVVGAVALFFPGLGSVSAWLTANAALITVVWSGANLVLRLITKDKIQLLD